MEKKRKTTDDELVPNTCAIFEKGPLRGYTPDDIREYLTENSNDWHLAIAFARVSNQTGWVHHDINDPDYDEEMIHSWLREKFNAWYNLYEELRRAVVARATERGIFAEGAAPEMKEHKQIDAYMNQNGYVCGCGWWVKKEK